MREESTPATPIRTVRWRSWLALSCVALLSACANTTDLDVRYQKAAPQFEHLLLVAKTPDASWRAQWESACQTMFRSLSTDTSTQLDPAWDGTSTFTSRQPLPSTTLIVDITPLLLAPPQMPGMMDVDGQMLLTDPNEDSIGIPTWNFFIGRKAKKLPEPPLLHSLEAQLLDQNGGLLWDGVMTTHEANDLKAIAKSQCRALKKDFVQQGYLPSRNPLK